MKTKIKEKCTYHDGGETREWKNTFLEYFVSYTLCSANGRHREKEEKKKIKSAIDTYPLYKMTNQNSFWHFFFLMYFVYSSSFVRCLYGRLISRVFDFFFLTYLSLAHL